MSNGLEFLLTFVTINISLRLTTPCAILARTAFPIAASFSYAQAVSICRYPISIPSFTDRSISLPFDWNF